jgi:hypothetical protein
MELPVGKSLFLFDKSLCNQDRPDGVVDNVGLALLLALGGTFHGGNGIGWQT